MPEPDRPLIGRENELELLDRLLGEARSGTPRLVSVAGEPGIGKTSLVAELVDRAERRGCLVFSGRATELEQELPFGLFVDALDRYLESLDARTYERLAGDGLGELASVFPALRSLGPRTPEPTTAAERFRAHHAVRELIERLAARQPVLLVLDDVHWSDGASLELVRHLMRRPPEAAVMVVATFRPATRAGPVILSETEAAALEGHVDVVMLGPLARGEATSLVGGAGPEVDRLYRESGGNPFYLLQLARSGGAAPRSHGSALGPEGIPRAVAAAIATELEELPSPARAFAQAASVTGDPFELDVAVATAAVPEPVALTALDQLIARDVIRPGVVPRTFRFRHPLVRSAIYASSSAGVRLVAHERAEATLAARGAPATTRAHHVEQCARHGDSAALAVLREAGRAAAQRAPSSAARWFAAALRILPAAAPAEERVELLLALAGARAETGRLEEAHAALLESLDLASDGASVPRVRLISACAGVEHLLGRHDEAHARLVRALRQLPDRDSAEAASLLIDLAVDAFYRMDFDAMRDRGLEAVATARPLGDPALIAATAGITALAGSCSGAVEEAQALCTEAAEIVDSIPDAAVAARLDALAWLPGAELYLDRYPEGIAHAERGLALGRATSQGELLPTLVQALGNLLFSSGRLADAAELLDGAIDAARTTDNAVGLAWCLLNRAYAAVLAGDVDVALRTGEEAAALTRDLHASVVGVWSGIVYGYALVEAGEPARAAEQLLSAAGGEEGPLVPGAWRANWAERLCHCWVELDRLEDAERAARRSDARATAFGLPIARALADRALAAVALARGDTPDAARLALASAEGAEQAGAPIEAALSRVLAGRALTGAGDADGAARELEAAAAAFEARGAVRHRDRAEHELRRLGRAVHRRTSRGRPDGGGVASLTGRELEVAGLVVDRRSNPEIAAALFLSIKTVETHLRNIFRKLGASSRVEVARIVERG